MKVAFRETPLGRMGMGEEGGRITNLWFEGSEVPAGAAEEETEVLTEAHRQLDAYLAGELKEFSLPLAPRGTGFQREVWEALRRIPYGETASYKEIAEAVGRPRAFRAVGMANNRNPIPVIIPCHRVIGSDGGLVGYGGGLDLKRRLLDLEKRGG